LEIPQTKRATPHGIALFVCMLLAYTTANEETFFASNLEEPINAMSA
jgi:hypothetical protein